MPDAASKKFASLDKAVEHEVSLTKQRRATWTNLIKGQTTAMKEHMTEDGDKTRAEVRAGLAPLAQLLGPDDDNATAAQLRMRKANMNKMYQDRINKGEIFWGRVLGHLLGGIFWGRSSWGDLWDILWQVFGRSMP